MTAPHEVAIAIEGHRRRNLELRDSLVQKGIALDDPRAVELHFWSAEQKNAALLARALYQSGLLILVLAPNEREDGRTIWNIEAGLKESISEVISSEFVEKMVRLATEYSSDFDGWGTSL